MVDEWARDDDYEYGYDYLYEEEKPTDAAEDADGSDDDTWWDDELDEAVEKRLADAREIELEPIKRRPRDAVIHVEICRFIAEVIILVIFGGE